MVKEEKSRRDVKSLVGERNCFFFFFETILKETKIGSQPWRRSVLKELFVLILSPTLPSAGFRLFSLTHKNKIKKTTLETECLFPLQLAYCWTSYNYNTLKCPCFQKSSHLSLICLFVICLFVKRKGNQLNKHFINHFTAP